MKDGSVCFWLGLFLVAAACANAPTPSSDGTTTVAMALRERDVSFQNAIEARDLERIISFYADDAVLLPAAVPRINGQAAIREEWDHVLAIPNFENESSLTKVEVSHSADLAYTMGTYVATVMGEDGVPIQELGKWLTVWKRQRDGAWRIVVDMYNTDVPPPDHK